MEFVYLLLSNDYEWEDMTIFLTETDAIKISIKYPKSRVEIFGKGNDNGYIPTYNYYQNGILIESK